VVVDRLSSADCVEKLDLASLAASPPKLDLSERSVLSDRRSVEGSGTPEISEISPETWSAEFFNTIGQEQPFDSAVQMNDNRKVQLPDCSATMPKYPSSGYQIRPYQSSCKARHTWLANRITGVELSK